ncbi:MAG: hypothetical protein FJ100_24050, partial [Deltaproteobacteria bacterium]|nr:hypothetical protein [Deltaproteobacteria bacterium]
SGGGGGGGGGGGQTADATSPADAVADGKTAVEVITGKADTGDNPTPDASTGGPDGLSANAKCCADKGAKCGYVPGCTNSCGGCPSGEKCDTTPNSKTIYTCIKSAPAKPLKKNGEACGPNAECVVPPGNASDAVQQEYYQCLNNQCEGGRCIFGVCTSQCKIAVDVKNNATGEKVENGDGIEDPDSQPSDCSGFVDGPAGKEFKCVQWFSPASPNQVYFCAPGTNFSPCKASADCKNGEVCSYRFVRGAYVSVCAPAYKEADGKPAQASVGGYCNSNPKTGAVATCKNNFCGGAGCIEFCKSDDDCVTDVGACKAGKCPNGDACAKDAECSAWMCKKDSKVFGPDQPAVDVCLPKSCYLDEDCKNPAYYCLTQYNGVKSQDGDPDPKDPAKVKMPSWEESACVKKAPNTAKKGEPCDDFPNDDDVTLKPCENKYWCVNATCSGHCKADKDCPSNSKCGVFEIPLDTSDPQDKKYDVFTGLKVCTPMPGATNACLGQSDCKAEAKAKYCRPYEIELPKPATGTADYKYTISGLCIEPEQGFGDPGAQCGPSNGKSCKSGICLGTQDNEGKTLPGWCTDFCNAKGDCPVSMT